MEEKKKAINTRTSSENEIQTKQHKQETKVLNKFSVLAMPGFSSPALCFPCRERILVNLLGKGAAECEVLKPAEPFRSSQRALTLEANRTLPVNYLNRNTSSHAVEALQQTLLRLCFGVLAKQIGL